MTFSPAWLAHPFVGLAVADTVADAVWSLGWQGCIVTGRTHGEATCHHRWETRWDLLP